MYRKFRFAFLTAVPFIFFIFIVYLMYPDDMILVSLTLMSVSFVFYCLWYMNLRMEIFDRYSWIYPFEKRSKDAWERFVEDYMDFKDYFSMYDKSVQNERTWEHFKEDCKNTRLG